MINRSLIVQMAERTEENRWEKEEYERKESEERF
jgi:hypothetical protein